MTDSLRHAPERVPSNTARLAAVAAAVLLAIVGLAGPAAAQQDEVPQERCSARAVDYTPSDCFSYEVDDDECGVLDVQFTRNVEFLIGGASESFVFRYAEGGSVPEGDGFDGDGGFPAAWPEDHNGGSVEVTFYIVGPESDYFEGHGSTDSFPNFWDGVGTTVTVDTDCEDEPVTTSPPRQTTTTTTPPETTTTTEATTTTTEVTTTTEESGVGGEFVEAPPVEPVAETAPAQVGGATLPRTGAGTGGPLLAASLVLSLGALLRTASRRLG